MLCVITATNTVTGKIRHYAIDRDNGGSWWTETIWWAQFFTSIGEAQSVIDAIPEQTASEKFPRCILHGALQIDNAHREGTVIFQVQEVVLRDVGTTRKMSGVVR